MTLRRPPGVFVSSTFYDLNQVRDGLGRFIQDDLGYTPWLSEQRTFPVDPDATTIENCQRRVRNDSDIFVLIVGARYGYVPDGQTRSVVNMEYLAAREVGLPVHVFIEQRVHTLYESWLRNPAIDLSADIPNPKLLDFIKEIADAAKAWVHRFSVTQDIIDTLRGQLAYRAQSAMALLNRIERRSDRAILETLPPTALRIAVEKEDAAWRGRVCAALLVHEIDKYKRQRQDYEDGIALGSGEVVPEGTEAAWSLAQTAAVLRLMTAFDNFVNNRLMAAIAQDDLELMVRAATSLAEAYGEALDWSRRVRCAYVQDLWRPVLDELAQTTRNAVETIESIGPKLATEIDRVVEAAQEGEDVTIELEFAVRVHNIDRLMATIDEQRRLSGQ